MHGLLFIPVHVYFAHGFQGKTVGMDSERQEGLAGDAYGCAEVL
jgi:hypothetical protein